MNTAIPVLLAIGGAMTFATLIGIAEGSIPAPWRRRRRRSPDDTAALQARIAKLQAWETAFNEAIKDGLDHPAAVERADEATKPDPHIFSMQQPIFELGTAATLVVPMPASGATMDAASRYHPYEPYCHTCRGFHPPGGYHARTNHHQAFSETYESLLPEAKTIVLTDGVGRRIGEMCSQCGARDAKDAMLHCPGSGCEVAQRLWDLDRGLAVRDAARFYAGRVRPPDDPSTIQPR